MSLGDAPIANDAISTTDYVIAPFANTILLRISNATSSRTLTSAVGAGNIISVTWTTDNTNVYIVITTSYSPGSRTTNVTVPWPNTTSVEYTPLTSPQVIGLLPSSGIVGSTVNILGEYLDGVSIVKIGSVDMSFTILDNTLISATIPIGATSDKIFVTHLVNGMGRSPSKFIVT